MNTGLALTRGFIVLAAVISIMLPIAWWWQLLTFICLLLLIIDIPLIRILLMEIGAIDIDDRDVILALRINQWQTVNELRKSIQRNQGVRRVSLLQVMNIAYKLAENGTIEGRERRPRQPSFFGIGNVWEYHQKPLN